MQTGKHKIITLIGMSGTGKSFWSTKLGERGFERLCCDDLIEERLAPELQRQGFRGLADVAKWLGQPYDQQFAANQQKYLTSEIAVMEAIVERLRTGVKENLVIDTTGSVIYTGKRLCSLLKRYSTMVYLDTTPTVLETMFVQYLTDPKPVLWGDLFQRQPGESNQAALARLYPQLLDWRTKQYRHYTDVSLDYHLLRSPAWTIDRFVQAVSQS